MPVNPVDASLNALVGSRADESLEGLELIEVPPLETLRSILREHDAGRIDVKHVAKYALPARNGQLVIGFSMLLKGKCSR